jgi:hypothetical protein
MVALAATLIALAAGCGDNKSSAKHEPTASPSAPARPSPSAADGTNLTACQDGTCEVQVRTGDQIKVNPTFGLDMFTVKSIEDGRVTLMMRGTHGGLEAVGRGISVSTNCANNRCQDEGELGLVTGMQGRVNKILLNLSAAGGGQAILKLTPQ